MGQYFIAVNETSKQFIHPHTFGDGVKFLEFCGSSHGFLAGLAFLLRKGKGDPNTGQMSWSGENVSIVGDYDVTDLYDKAQDEFEDVSFKVIEGMANSCGHMKSMLSEKVDWRRYEGCGAVLADATERAEYDRIFGKELNE